MRGRAAPGPGEACGLWWERQPRDHGMGHPRSRNICVDMNMGIVPGGRGRSQREMGISVWDLDF